MQAWHNVSVLLDIYQPTYSWTDSLGSSEFHIHWLLCCSLLRCTAESFLPTVSVHFTTCEGD